MVNDLQDRCVYVYNRTRETFVGTEVSVANNILRRLKGLLGKTSRWAQSGRGLWIIPCRGVHTIGMMFPVDLVFINRAHRVVRIQEFVRPFRIASVSFKAYSVIELPAHTIYRTGTREGDCLEISWSRNRERMVHLPAVLRAEDQYGCEHPPALNADSRKPAGNDPAAFDRAG
jgi:hypothetical protein